MLSDDLLSEEEKKGFSFTLHPKNIIVYTISILIFLIRFIEKFLCDFQKCSRILSVILKSTKWFIFDKVGLTNPNEVFNYFALVSIKSPFFCLAMFSYSSEFLEVSLLFTNNHTIYIHTNRAWSISKHHLFCFIGMNHMMFYLWQTGDRDCHFTSSLENRCVYCL